VKQVAHRVVSQMEAPPKQSPRVGRHRWARPALHYFQHWSAGKLARGLDPRLASGDSAEVAEATTPASLSKLLQQHQDRECPEKSLQRLLDSWEVHHAATSADGVRHTLLRSTGGRLQYLAARGGRLLVADPPACPKASSLSTIQGEAPGKTTTPAPLGGEEESLAKDDPVVQDCVELVKKRVRKSAARRMMLTSRRRR
jgi:hypothetical protein